MATYEKHRCIVCQTNYLTRSKEGGYQKIRNPEIKKRGIATCGNKKCQAIYRRIASKIKTMQRKKR